MYVYVRVYVYICVYVCIYMCVCVYVCVCLCVCVRESYPLGVEEGVDPAGFEPGAVCDILAGGSPMRLLLKH